jgi:type III pantothenate kinase
MTPRLLIDAGNTRAKWAVVSGDVWLTQGEAAYDDLSGLSADLAPGMRAYVAGVARDAQLDRVCAVLAPIKAIHWLESSARCAGVENGYAAPVQLGVDRWMNLIGAWQRTHGATLVVSAGTALTIDALDDAGRFIGGLIAPGRELMRAALRQGTARVDVPDGVCQDFPTNTADAVESGITAALCGAVQAQYARLATRCAGRAPRCLVTGGDAARLMPCLRMPAERVPALTLEGMARVSREADET